MSVRARSRPLNNGGRPANVLIFSNTITFSFECIDYEVQLPPAGGIPCRSSLPEHHSRRGISGNVPVRGKQCAQGAGKPVRYPAVRPGWQAPATERTEATLPPQS